MTEDRSTTAPHGVGHVVARVVLAGLAVFSGVFGFGMAALAGCCESNPEGWPLFVLWLGLSWGLAMWSIAIVTRQRSLPLFCLAGVGLAALQLLA